MPYFGKLGLVLEQFEHHLEIAMDTHEIYAKMQRTSFEVYWSIDFDLIFDFAPSHICYCSAVEIQLCT